MATKIPILRTPFHVRQTTKVNQISLPKEYLAEIAGTREKAYFKVTCDKSKKVIHLELIESTQLL
jgi:hypothetical protein